MRAITAIIACLSTTGVAQVPAMIVAPAPETVLHVGTAVQLETREELTTERKALKVGQPVEMDVQQPVMLAGQVVIPAGSRVVGEVTSVRNKGMWGKSGGITARILYLEANGRRIKLNGSFNDRGETGTAGVVAAVALVPVAGFFVTGTSAKIPAGRRVTAFIAEEVPVQFAAAVPIASPASTLMAGGPVSASPTAATPGTAVLTKTAATSPN